MSPAASVTKSPLRWLAILAVLALTALAVALIWPNSRHFLMERLHPIQREGALILRATQVQNDHGELRLKTRLRLSNNTSTTLHPLGAQPALRLEAADGSLVSPATVPGLPLPVGLVSLAPGEHWDGELGWWLAPSQNDQPLTLIWLENRINIPPATSQTQAERQLPLAP